jgi:hypothetical protein
MTDRTDESTNVSMAVVEAIAHERGVDAADLRPPLYEVVDPEALDALFEAGRQNGTEAVRIEFEYAGYGVSIVTDEAVEVRPVTDSQRRREQRR